MSRIVLEPGDRLGRRYGTLPKDPRLRAGQVDDRRRNTAERSFVQRRARFAETQRYVVQRERVGSAGIVRARRGDAPDRFEYRGRRP
jgi:hypothetical protein